ncbi:MAG: alkaline phosphatase family protein [Planctomycetota bacterium]
MHRFTFALLLAAFLAAPARADDKPPALLVLLTVDQLRPDVLQRYRTEYTGGLKRLLEDGVVFAGEQAHAATETGPGHSALATGCHPSKTGISSNQWLDPKTGAPVYCVEQKGAFVYGDSRKGRGPALQRRSTLGDWMKAANPRSRVVSVSAKDRAAVLMGGRDADGVYWYSKRAGRFTTSRHYARSAPPAWLAELSKGWFQRLPAQWTYTVSPLAEADERPGEDQTYASTTPHPVPAGRAKRARFVYYSPFIDDLTLKIAERAINEHDLGTDGAPDLLCVSLSAVDTTGHRWGPFSQEVRDTLMRLDRELGRFLAMLDKRCKYRMAVGADHGVLPLLKVKRVSAMQFHARVATAVRNAVGDGKWLLANRSSLLVDHALAAKKGVDPSAILAAAKKSLLASPHIASVYLKEDLEGSETSDPVLSLLRHSVDPERSADLYFVPHPGVIISGYRSGTTHGSPYDHDRNIPVIFFGAGIGSGTGSRKIRSIDVAPTMAAWLGVTPAAGIDGQAVALAR